MARRIVFLCILLLMVLACETPPETIELEAAVEEPLPVPEGPAGPPAAAAAEAPQTAAAVVEEKAKGFDPADISEEVYQSTKVDIQNLVENLNQIIRAKNFNAWVSYLSRECLEERSASTFLSTVSRGPRLQNQKPLTDVRDYFMRVVVPSRDHDRVDDIEFIDQYRVKAYTVNTRGDRLRLYDLEYIGDRWKIVD